MSEVRITKKAFSFALLAAVLIGVSGLVNEFLYEFNFYQLIALYLIGAFLFIKLIDELKGTKPQE